MGRPVFVFCHGLNGHGQYDEKYRKRPYWGGKSGDVVGEWRALSHVAVAASVSPHGSAWDRAAELYAQLAGTRCDYGVAHSRRCAHERFGPDYTGRALIDAFDDDTPLYLIGHSFGGATTRLFTELLAHGSEEERQATPDGLSPLFAGGMGERVRTIVTLAAPHNGTTAYDLTDDPDFDARTVRVPMRYRLLDKVLKHGTTVRMDGRDTSDWASFDMTLDNARELNGRIEMLPHVCYISLACDATKAGPNGTRVADTSAMDPLFTRTSCLMGAYEGVTAGGQVADAAWHENDGLVNTISARAPFGSPSQPLDRKNLVSGVWQVMEDMHADHGFFCGGYLHKQDPHPFFRDLLDLLLTIA